MTNLIIIPLLNKKVSLFSGPLFYFNDELFIEKLKDEEHSAFFRDALEEHKSALDLTSTKCIKLKTDSLDKKVVKILKTKTTFCLNIFSDKPIITTWAGILKPFKKNQLKVEEILEFEALAGLKKIRSNEFKLHNGTNRPTFSEFYVKLNEAIIKSPESIFTLEKYNSSLLRTEFFDKIVDMTICFETLIPGNAELTYKLSLYIAFITSKNPAEREEIFEKMKTLYEVRSKIVHGDLNGASIKRKLENVEIEWKEYQTILKKAVVYFLIYLSINDKTDWEIHLKKLVLGTETQIV